MKTNVIKDSEIVVDRLILQYKEYIKLIEEIKSLEQEYVNVVSKIAKKEKLNPINIMSNYSNYSKLVSIKNQIRIYLNQSEQISDEMTFKDPIVWMIYKFKAYKGTPKEISNWQQFKDHCKPEGYVCTQRYIFLRKYLKEKLNINIDDTSIFPNSKSLSDIYSSKDFLNLLTDFNFMQVWQENEYKKTDGVINKWNTKIQSS